jgi:hypothetical protein
VCERCGFEEVGFDEMFIMLSAEIFGDGGSPGIACPAYPACLLRFSITT